jgi:hypothetical protein
MEGDVDYFAARASEERRLATKATHPQARDAHLQMAERYKELATRISARQRKLGGA